LAGLLVFAPEIRGVRGWYKIGGISIDPIEYMKMILIVLMAKYFALRHTEVYRIRHIFYTGTYFFIPALLIAFQPDLGPVLVLTALWIVILLVAGIKVKHFLGIALLALVLLGVSWQLFLLDHQKDRIVSFLEPELDPLGIGWSQLQSKIAIGNGGLFGQGFGQGSQTQYGFLSEPQTDFIFSAIAEEFGIFGVSVIFALLLILLWRVLKIGIGAQGNFARLVAAGFATLLIAQTFINVGMNLGLLPIIGLSLPLVSYGGSSLILTYIGLGFLLSIKTH
jgi:rod shape determining protein RodA